MRELRRRRYVRPGVNVERRPEVAPCGCTGRRRRPATDDPMAVTVPVASAAAATRRRAWLARTSASSRSRSQRRPASAVSAARSAARAGSPARFARSPDRRRGRTARRVRRACGSSFRSPRTSVTCGDGRLRRGTRARRPAPAADRLAMRRRGCGRRGRRRPPPSPPSSTRVGTRSSSDTGPATRPGRTRTRDDQRHADRRLERRHLVPEAALAEHVAVIGRDDHDVSSRRPCSSRVSSKVATCSSTSEIAAR